MLEFRVLGPLEVVGNGAPVRLGGPRQRATLAILLLSANRVVPVERLADELYAGRPPVSAVTQVQRQVSELRRALGAADAIETRAPGYLLRVPEAALDLARFERLTAEAERTRGRDDRVAAALLREALDLWRGPPLGDLADESFVRAAAQRLDELRLAALEERIDTDLALGRHATLVGELETLVTEHPLRERFRAQLMLALYRDGRQAEALLAYREARARLVADFGLEPSVRLRELEQAILTQDPALTPPTAAAGPPRGTVLVAPSRDDAVGGLVGLLAPAAIDGRELLVARLVAREEELEGATAALAACRGRARTAAFTSDDPAADLIHFAVSHGADLLVVDAPTGIDDGPLAVGLAALLERSPAHVAVVAGKPRAPGPVYVPFGGGEHDWAALELGALLASAAAQPLRLLGTRADPRGGRRDASRLLADASLAVQRVADVDVAPLLADANSLVEAVEAAALVVVGISPRWRQEGIGEMRRALVRGGTIPVAIVCRGPRPGALAPRERRTRFTWTIGATT